LGKLTRHLHTNQAHAHAGTNLPQPRAGSYTNGASHHRGDYQRLMCDPTMAETWKMAFGKDAGGIAQGDLKTGQKGTNSIFIMTHNKILRIPRNQTVTYAHTVVNF
jgi:hypothetical protein